MRVKARLGIVVLTCVAGVPAFLDRGVAMVAAQGPSVSPVGRGDNWAQHNFAFDNARYSPLDDINTSNVDRLTLKWSYRLPAGEVINQVTPIVLDGVMYFNAGSTLYALDAATGQLRWTSGVEPSFPGSALGRRGPASDGAGVIYSYGGSGSKSILYAMDGQGKPVERFGNKGRLQIADAAVHFKYPDRDPTGYEMAAPPVFHDGTLYVALAQSEKRILGGLVAAIDAKTGALKWVFNTIPQTPQDDGWELIKDTWSGERIGGGVWTTPALDPELGLLYINAGNPIPAYAGNTRHGTNLFTNSTIALRMDTGKLAWYYQTLHHDIWDWDLVTGPVLFDVTGGNRRIRGVGAAGKNCLLYLWNRENGQPINPIVETVVPATSDMPGEAPWPTQPVPYNAKGVPMQPFCQIFPMIADQQLVPRARQMFTPYSTKDLNIVSHGGSSFGSPSFSPRTGLLYVTGKNAAASFVVRPFDKSMLTTPGVNADGMGKRDFNTGVPPTENVTAYNPATGEVVWQFEQPAVRPIGSAGNLVTAGDVVFQGGETGELSGLDARTGKRLFVYKTPDSVKASPLTFRANGRQYVTVVANESVVTLGLP